MRNRCDHLRARERLKRNSFPKNSGGKRKEKKKKAFGAIRESACQTLKGKMFPEEEI